MDGAEARSMLVRVAETGGVQVQPCGTTAHRDSDEGESESDSAIGALGLCGGAWRWRFGFAVAGLLGMLSSVASMGYVFYGGGTAFVRWTHPLRRAKLVATTDDLGTARPWCRFPGNLSTTTPPPPVGHPPDVRYQFIATTLPPKEEKYDVVSCPAGQPFTYPALFVRGLPRFQNSVLPPPDVWEEIWAASLNSYMDGCATPLQATVRLPSKDHGFGSAMNNFVNEALVSIYAGIPMSLCSPLGVRDQWAENFVNPGLSVCGECALPAADGPQIFYHGAEASMLLASQAPEQLVPLKRLIYKKLFQLRPEVEEGATGMQKRLGIYDEPYVGIHYRRGDKLKEAGLFRPMSAFVEHALRLCDAIGAKKVFVASDDPGATSGFKARMRKDIQVVAQASLTTQEYAQRGVLEDRIERVLLYDLVLLMRANAYVGTASSNLDRWVWFQRPPSQQTISLDDGGSFLYRAC